MISGNCPCGAIPLSNRNGSQVVDGLRVDNRLDALGENHVFWPADAVSGDMPAALQIRLINDRQEGLEIDSLYLGSSRACYQDLPVLEGEAAVSSQNFSVVADSSCNGAACGRVQWSSSEELELYSWQIPGEQLSNFAGTVLRPLLRFPDADSFPAGYLAALGYPPGRYSLSERRQPDPGGCSFSNPAGYTHAVTALWV